MIRSFHLFIALLGGVVEAQTWCGKHYMQGSSVIKPGGNFKQPASSSEPLLSFKCTPAIKPYIAGESNASVIVDAEVVHLKVPGAAQLGNTSKNGTLHVSVSIENTTSHAAVAINSTGTEIPLSLAGLEPRKEAYTVTCTAVESGTNRTFHTSSQLSFLPQPAQGSVTKQDMRTGTLLVKGKNATEYEPLFALGFYTSFDGFLTNTSNVDAVKARGMNLIHPVPTFDNQTAFVEMLDRMEELGIWLMYDMRFTYQNHSSVTEQVNFIKNRTNLLLWYTGDEPDGTSDPLNATKTTYDLIYSLDGYHPVSLVLNCQDYFFDQYSLGADVLMQDTYPIDINATFSTVWNTSCTPDFGDCGCDNCKGSMSDISERVDEFKERLKLLGRERTTSVWSVPQAFGNESYWPRYPTGNEWLVESVLGINHGSLGIVPWDDPTSPQIMAASSLLASALPSIVPFLSSPTTSASRVSSPAIDAAFWTMGNQTLLLAANPSGANESIPIEGFTSGTATQILNGGGMLVKDPNGQVNLVLGSMETTGWVIER